MRKIGVRSNTKNLLVTIAKTAEFLLSCGIPHIKVDLSVVCEERHRVDLDSESGDVLLFELTSHMALHKSSLSDTTISDKH